MPKTNFDISMSLDGYITASDRSPDEPMGKGGEHLHAWGLGENADPRGLERIQQLIQATGAVICGRRTYDDSVRWWGADGPSGADRIPTFVVTHAPPTEVPENSVYIFVPDIETAMTRAKATAGDKDVSVSGASTIQQCLRAGYIDEFTIHLVPVLFHGGVPLFEQINLPHTHLEPIDVITSPVVTHLHYRVLQVQ